MKKIYLLLLVLVTLFVACKKDRDVEFSTFTVEDENIVASYTSMDLSCKVRCAATINEFYLQYDTVADFSTYQEVELVENKKTDVYSVKIDDLLDNTTYYVRYVAVNSFSQVTSEEISQFQTLKATIPTIEVREIIDVLDTIATVGFVLKFDGGVDVEKMGVCWSVDSVPTIDSTHVVYSIDAKKGVVDGDSLFMNISELKANTTYYVRAYAENIKGICYSQSKAFVTLTLPEVETEDVTDIQLTSGWLNGLVLFNGNDTTTEYGFCWGEEATLAIDESQNVKVEVAVDSTFTYRLSNLKDETKYYVRAYAKNKIGLAYGEVKEFTTQSTILAVVVTAEASDVTYTSAKVGGKVETDGGSDVEERGICYSTTKSPTIENKKVVLGSGLGSFTTELSDLQDGTKYYVRAYAKNKKGVSYGETVMFETKAYLLAEVITSSPTEITYTSAIVGGTVVSDGGVEVVERGVCYSRTENPTIADSKIVVDKGLGSFSITLSGLQEGAKYYVRAYAINKKGVSYGEIMEFETRVYILPVVETIEPTDVTYTSVKVGGNVVYDGGLDVIERGICYSEAETPTIVNDKIVVGKGVGSFSIILSNLKEGTTYYVCAYIINNKGVVYGEIYHFKTLDYIENGYRYVDLGLSVKWATCNVGADKPEDSGDYFAWGEVEPKTTYNWSTYKYCVNNYNNLTKYCNNSSFGNNGFTDNKTILESGDDVATVNWGGGWRMPTKAEQDELRNKCTWVWTTENGVKGYRVISKVNGYTDCSIFLPIGGFKDGANLYSEGSIGYYLSSSSYIVNSYHAYYLNINSQNVECSSGNRSYGRSVRPVYGESSQQPETKRYTISVYSHDNSRGTVSGGGTYNEGSQVSLTATAKLGYKFKEWNDGNTDNPRVITVTKDAIYTAHFEAEKNLNAGHEYVDLGLPSGLKWATCNVGATTPEDYGDYFAWGEVKPKKQYDWSTYKYCVDNWDNLTKYCNNSNYGKDGFMDNKTVLEPEDDAATANWGGAWRMPTKAEQDELRNNCTCTWTTQNGVNGYKVTGPNGNSIFLPAAGYMSGGTLFNAGSSGDYWSSSLYTDEPDDAFVVRSDSYNVVWYINSRYDGLSVRPIYGESSQQPEIKRYTISVYSHDNSRGIVSGGGTYNAGSQVAITATANSGYRFKEWNDGNTDNPRIITVTKDAIYTAHFEVEKNLNAGHEYVDLGLPSGLKWATCNVGANAPEEYGYYFAWGEVEPKTTYHWSTYKYGLDADQLTKYCYDSSYGKDGFTDNKTELDPEDDAATANWGGAWRMPTKAEQQELLSNCTWTWTTQNGVDGYKVTGPNGNSIFLPAAGYMLGGTLNKARSIGFYWSSSLNTSYSYYAYYAFFDSSSVNRVNYSTRYYGHSVRPVCQ